MPRIPHILAPITASHMNASKAISAISKIYRTFVFSPYIIFMKFTIFNKNKAPFKTTKFMR